ncbi:MAG: phenylalanine--tRNA ligase subunit beta [bacterium]
MIFSYKWLNNLVSGKLPAVKELSNILTNNIAEVDSIETAPNGEVVLDVKVLPNLAHSCLSHRGLARMIGAKLDLPVSKYSRDFKTYTTSATKNKLEVVIENSQDCRRYVGRLVEGIKVGPSPEWLKNALETIGQRSINNVVDATNYVMFELGQPMHAFDADKLVKNEAIKIEIKKAKTGQKLVTLDGKDVVLDESIMIISSNERPLAVAGVKGGIEAELEDSTVNLVLESANFNPTLVRKTAQKIKIQTDAVKRYENEITPELAGEAMEVLTKIILEVAGTIETKIGEVFDNYQNPQPEVKVAVSVFDVNSLTGMSITEAEVADVLRRLNFTFEKNNGSFLVTIPTERLDLRLKQDLVEDIAMIYGYDKIPDIKVEKENFEAVVNKNYYYTNKIRLILGELGFSEVVNYSFVPTGEIEVMNPLNSELPFLRNNLSYMVGKNLELNARNSDLVGMPQIKIYEIGKVFSKTGETSRLCLGVRTPVGVKGLPKDMAIIDSTVQKIKEVLGADLTEINKTDGLIEIDFDKLVSVLSEPTSYDFTLPVVSSDFRFKKISAYPYMVRDIAVFVPEVVTEKDLLSLIETNATELLVKIRLFDVFAKKFPDGLTKTSYAYRLIFQSYERTLEAGEVDIIMQKIVEEVTKKGWQVR